MGRFHLQPETGDAKICKAKKRCPFGDMDTDHYDSPEEARAAYERSMAQAMAGLPMDHTPRANWVELDEDRRDSIYGNYMAVVRVHNKVGRRNSNASGFPAKRKQYALQVTADRYHVPVSQVKSIVQQLQEQAGRTVDSDRARQARADWLLGVAKEWQDVTFNESGDAVCRCGGTEEVELRYDPFAAEIHGENVPMVSCIECWGNLRDEI